MSERLLNVEVVTKEDTVWLGASPHVSLPTVDGRVGVLPGRQPMLAVLQSGQIAIDQVDGDRVNVQVEAGFVSVDADFITVVAEGGVILSAS